MVDLTIDLYAIMLTMILQLGLSQGSRESVVQRSDDDPGGEVVSPCYFPRKETKKKSQQRERSFEIALSNPINCLKFCLLC